MAVFIWFASADMMDRYRSHARVGAMRIVSFRRRWANKTDTAIMAALNYFWAKRMDRSAAALKKETEKLRH